MQEQAVQYEATITELNEDKEIYTQENIQYEATIAKLNEDKKFYTQENVDLEGQVHDLQSEMVELKSENAALRQLDSKHQSVRSLSPTNYHSGIANTMAQSIHKLNEEIGTLRQTVIDQKYAHDTVRAKFSSITLTVFFMHHHRSLTLLRMTKSMTEAFKAELRSSQRS